MSVKKFCWLLNEAKVGKHDEKWLPKWLRRDATIVTSVRDNLLPSTRNSTARACRCHMGHTTLPPLPVRPPYVVYPHLHCGIGRSNVKCTNQT